MGRKLARWQVCSIDPFGGCDGKFLAMRLSSLWSVLLRMGIGVENGLAVMNYAVI